MKLTPSIQIALFWYCGLSSVPAFHFTSSPQKFGFNLKLDKSVEDFQKNFQKSALATVISFSLIFGTNFNPSNAAGDLVFNEVWGVVNDNFVDKTFNGNDWNEMKKTYTEKLNQGADEREITKKMLSVLGDKYTRLLDKEYFESIWKYDAIGVGLLFQSDPKKNNQMLVASPPVSGSSSLKAGLKKGDFIYSINGVSTEKMSAMQLLDMMSNDEKSTVILEYSHTDSEGNPIDEKKTAELKRSTEKAVNPVKFASQKLKNGKTAGYIRLGEFNAAAVPGLKEALTDLNAKNIDELLLDLRGNTGGGFQFALNIGGMFMDNKDMVTALGRGDEKNVFKSSYPDGVLYNKPLILLTDGLSASASEVLAGGLHDNCRATIAGATTFGKGKIQAVFGLADGEGLTMTVAQYVTPRGTIIQSKGLPPDIPIASLNPYLAMLAGPTLTKPDLEIIEFDKSDSLIKICQTQGL
jgi:carboxyl-terminal processing protease